MGRLLGTFNRREDQPADRAAINSYLRRLGLRVTIDGENGAMGLAVGDQPPEWALMHRELDMAYLARGMTGIEQILVERSPELTELMRRLPRTEEGLIDLSGPFEAFFESTGTVLAEDPG